MFKNMVDIASQAKHEVSLPSPKQSRVCILQMFKEQLQSLCVCLLVCFSLSYIDFCLLTNCRSVTGYMLEPHCQGWSQPHMWCVAGQQLQCILRSDWPLDWGACGWQVNHRDCTNWVCPNEHGSWWHASGPSIIQGLQLSWDCGQGKYRQHETNLN